MAQHFPDNAISRRIDPIISDITVTEKIDNRPGIINLRPTEEIAIIPRFQGRKGCGHGKVFCHLGHFLWRKSNDIPIGSIHDGANVEIIQIAENTLFGHPQDPRQYGKIQVAIALQDTAQELFHKSDALCIKTMFPSLLNRRIVFINQ